MWAWGTGIFQNEDAWDIRQVYLQRLAQDDDPAAAAASLAGRFLADAAGHGTVFWPALAAAQSEAGALLPDVSERALAVLDGGAVEEAWREAGALQAEIRGARAALGKLRAELTQPGRPPDGPPRALTPRNRIRTMLAPYWRRLTPRAQQVGVLVGNPPPRDLERIRRSLDLLEPGQAWLVVAQATRSLRWQKAFCDEVVMASRGRLALHGVGADEGVTAGAARAGSDAQHDDRLLLARFEPEQQELGSFMAALWDAVHDDPALLRPPSYPASLKRPPGTAPV
jgi:hypothetical protein